MKFIKINIIALLFVLFACLSELAYLDLLSSIEWLNVDGVSYNLGDFIYYFFNQVGYLSLIPSILLYRICKNKESKGIYFGLIVWNGYEVIQELNYLLKLNIDFLSKLNNMGNTYLQILFILTLVFLTYQAHTKWRYLSRLFQRF